MQTLKHEGGQALILIVFGILALVGIVGLAVDGGNAYSDRRKAQNAADAAALAGALARVNSQDFIQAALGSAARNGFNNDGTHNTVQVYSPPISGANKGDLEYIQVRITSHIPTYFAMVVGIPTITNTVEAVSRTDPPQYAPMVGGAAVASLSPFSDCDNNIAFAVQQEATLDIWGGGVFVNSSNPTCALKQWANGSIRIRDGEQIRVAGGASIQKPGLLTPYPPITGATQLPYPPPFFMPDFNCGGKMAQIIPGTNNMSPGNWNDVFPPEDATTLNLQKGIYCLNSDFIISDNQILNGNGVTFKIEHGRVLWAGKAQLDIKAPSTGKLAGLLLYQPQDNQNYLAINGNAYSNIRGTILAPGAEIRIKGNASSYGFHSQIIGLTINVQGDDDIKIMYNPDDNYLALTMPQITFTK